MATNPYDLRSDLGRVSARSYLIWYKRIKSAFRDGYTRVRISWSGPLITEVEFNDAVRDALNWRIAIKGNQLPTGRKTTDEYIRLLELDRLDIHRKANQRVRLYHLRSKDMQSRFSHLIDSRLD
jgi:hypothetical protein